MKKIFYLISCLIVLSSCKKEAPAAINVINEGVSGNTAASLLARITGVTSQKPNLVIVMIGTNEAILGDTTYVNFKRNLTKVVTTLQAAGAKVLLMTPPPIISPYNINTNGPHLDTVCATVRLVSQAQGCEFVDTYNNLYKVVHAYIPPTVYNVDGVHLNKQGYQDLTDLLSQYLKNSIYKNEKIICFGDSLTYGLNVNGEGTITGDTYPADLFRNLNTYYYANNN